MIYRSLLLLVASFWLTMWFLLIHSETSGGTAVRGLPVDHVLREIFQHDQASDLWINDGQKRIGHLRLAPKMNGPGELRTLEFFGHLELALPGANLQRLLWDGRLAVDAQGGLADVHFSTTTREVASTWTPVTRLEMDFNPRNRHAAYVLKNGDTIMDRQELTLDKDGLTQLLGHLGIDQAWQAQLARSPGHQPELAAQQSTLLVHGEKLETYLLTLTYQGQTLFEAQVSQLGEILHAHTLVGWTLDPSQ